MLLSMIAAGEIAQIDELCGGEEVRQRLADMGFLPGRIVSVIGFAPGGGDPIEVEVMGSRISIRRNEAALIRIKPLEGRRIRRKRQRRWLGFF